MSFLLGNRPAGAPAATWVDNYDDQDVAEYSFERGASNEVTFETTSPIQGTATLREGAANGRVRGYATSTTGSVDNLISKGSTFQCKVRFGYGTGVHGQSGILYGVGDGSNYYAIRYEQGDQQFIALEVSGGSTNVITFETPTDSGGSGTVYRIEVVWDDGTLGGNDDDHTWTLYDETNSTQLSQLTANNSTHATNTGIGFTLFDNDGTGYVDLDAYEDTT